MFEVDLPMLEVSCARYARHGRLYIAKLIERHGTDAKLRDLRSILAGDCARVGETSIYERCGVRRPKLAVSALR
jgi:hypothetical protein